MSNKKLPIKSKTGKPGRPPGSPNKVTKDMREKFIAQKEKASVFFAFREIPVAIARIIVFSLAILFATNLKILFLVAGLVYVLFFFWKKQSNHKLIK